MAPKKKRKAPSLIMKKSRTRYKKKFKPERQDYCKDDHSEQVVPTAVSLALSGIRDHDIKSIGPSSLQEDEIGSDFDVDENDIELFSTNSVRQQDTDIQPTLLQSPNCISNSLHDLLPVTKNSADDLKKSVTVTTKATKKIISSPARKKRHVLDHAYCSSIIKKKKKKPNKQSVGTNEDIENLMEELRESAEELPPHLRSPQTWKLFLHKLCSNLSDQAEKMGNRKHGLVSVLMNKKFEEQRSFSWKEIIKEMATVFPELTKILVSIMLETEKQTPEHLCAIVPRLGLIYSILLQERKHELTLTHHVLSKCLADTISDQKLYDRLNKIGVTLSYSRSLVSKEEVGSKSIQFLVEALQEGKHIRLIGDNLNFTQDTAHERMDRHKHMTHMFATAALINDKSFTSLPNDSPEIPLSDLSVTDVLLSKDEYELLRYECVRLISSILVDLTPQLYLEVYLQQSRDDCTSNHDRSATSSKTKVVPLEVLPLNEQRHDDVVKILKYYEDLLKKIEEEANAKFDSKVQIGGDQLTRERFSTALKLRLRNPFSDESFSHLGPVTIEYFHTFFHIQRMVFNQLFKSCDVEAGTMNQAKERLHRSSVDPDGLKAYEANKDFLISYHKSYLVSAVCNFYGMQSRFDQPTLNTPPLHATQEEISTWVAVTLGRFVDEYIFPCWSGSGVHQPQTQNTDDRKQKGSLLTVTLASGKTLKLMSQVNEVTVNACQPDFKKNYAHLSLELLTAYILFMDLCKTPDRNKLLPAIKMQLALCKSNNSAAKYPLELLRVLVQQYSLLPVQKAFQTLKACFVNTRGKADTHIPADQQMEWVVGVNKKYIKNMYSNKDQSLISKMSLALPGVREIADNFDHTTGVVVRAQKHSRASDAEDVDILLNILSEVQPFKHENNRVYKNHTKIHYSLLEKFDGEKFKAWFEKKKNSFQ